ncbi:MAG: hypothetical protein ACYCW6_16385 [Candidatus Xenobia bacterium]
MRTVGLLVLLLALLPGLARSRPAAPLMPLAVGNAWEYDTNGYGTMTMKVTRQEVVDGHSCFVLETFLESPPDRPVQTEYLTQVGSQLEVLKRRYAEGETVLTPPEVLLHEPLHPGEHWSWDGQSPSGPVHLEFKVVHAERVRVPGLPRDVICQKLVMTGHTVNGGSIDVQRWYAPGIGMVKEVSLMMKGRQSMQVVGRLKRVQATP